MGADVTLEMVLVTPSPIASEQLFAWATQIGAENLARLMWGAFLGDGPVELAGRSWRVERRSDGSVGTLVRVSSGSDYLVFHLRPWAVHCPRLAEIHGTIVEL